MTTDGDGLFPGPCHGPGGEPDGLLTFRRTLTEAEFARFKARWERAQRKHRGHPKVLGLPWHGRLRLWWAGCVDSAAIWLCEHGRNGDAAALWWLTGGWR